MLYCSGPITGQPDGNRSAFAAAQRCLEDAGYTVINPHALGHPPDVSWEQAMATDLAALRACAGVALLAGWRLSQGAQIEAHQAEEAGQPVADVVTWIQIAQMAQWAWAQLAAEEGERV